MSEPVEHASYHASDVVRLAGYDAAADTGWSAYVSEDVGGRPRVHLQGIIIVSSADGGRTSLEFTIDAAQALALLWATSAPESALHRLLDQVGDQP